MSFVSSLNCNFLNYHLNWDLYDIGTVLELLKANHEWLYMDLTEIQL